MKNQYVLEVDHEKGGYYPPIKGQSIQELKNLFGSSFDAKTHSAAISRMATPKRGYLLTRRSVGASRWGVDKGCYKAPDIEKYFQ